MNKLKILLEEDKSLINIADNDGYTPLHRACYSNHVELVDFLLQNGANISAKTRMHWEPLHSCCQWNNTQCALRLIQNGADVNAKSEGGALLNIMSINHIFKIMFFQDKLHCILLHHMELLMIQFRYY